MRGVVTIPFATILLCLSQGIRGDPVTYSLGDLKKYVGSSTIAQTLSGTVLEWSGPSATTSGIPQDGIDVYFSTDLQEQLMDTVKSDCNKVDQTCQESVKAVLTGEGVDLQAREANPGLAIFGSIAVGIIAVIVPQLYNEDKEIPVPLHIPSAQLSQADAGASATEIAIATGTDAPYITITQSPQPTSLTGSTPVISTVTQASNGNAKGDVIITMPSSLASRVEELIRRSNNNQCPAGLSFHSKHRKRLVDFASVICASQELLINAQPDAALRDLLVLHPAALPWAAADAVRAMNEVISFARDFASVLELDAQTAASVGVAAFALAWEVIINNKDLATENVIPASALSSTTTSACATTTANQCFVNCRMKGAIEACTTDCDEKTSCGASSFISTTATVPWTVTDVVTTSLTGATPTASCGATQDQAMDPSVVEGFIDTFCTGTNFSDSSSVKKTSEADSEGATVEFEYASASGCDEDDCKSLLYSLVTSCEYDSHSLYTSGSISASCGNFSLTPSFPSTTTSTSAAATSSTSTNKSGTKDCTDYSTNAHFSQKKVQSAIRKQCKKLHSQGTSIAKDGGAWQNAGTWTGSSRPGIDTSSKELEVAITLTPNKDACPEGSDYYIDFGTWTVDACVGNWTTGMNGCAPYSPPVWSDPKWKAGGSYFDYCLQWEIGSVQKS